MNRRIFKVFIVMCSILFGLLGTYRIVEAQDLSWELIDTPTGSYQLDCTVPIQIEDEKFDNSILTNSFYRFIAYQNQGSLLIKSDDISEFKLFVNGEEAKVTDVPTQTWVKLDISSLTQNGTNYLQILANRENEQSHLSVKIPYPVLVENTEAYEDNSSFKLIDDIIEAEIQHGFPSAQIVIIHNGQIVKKNSYGRVNRYNQDGSENAESEFVTDDTLYDLASNTKMYATNLLIQYFVSKGEISVDQKISEFIPEFKDRANDKIKGKSDLTIRDLLEHQAGFPADPQYHNNNYDAKAEDFYGKDANALYTQSKEQMLSKIIETPLEYQPGTDTKYSDVDYILLGIILEKISGKDLDSLAKEIVYEPLSLDHLTFNPLNHGFDKSQIAATELNGNTRDGVINFNNIRKETIQGEVHDEKAFYSMEGVSGHAGLFGNASDLAVLTQLILNKGGYGEVQLFDSSTLEQFIKPKNTSNSYGLGWRRNGDNLYAKVFSPLVSNQAIGHTGWTGTLTIIDPDNHLAIVLLTNKKNSPVIDNKENPHRFDGDKFLSGGYGLIATLAASGTLQNETVATEYEIIELVDTKYQLIQSHKDYNTKADKASLLALYEVLESRSELPSIQKFLESDRGKAISEYINEIR